MLHALHRGASHDSGSAEPAVNDGQKQRRSKKRRRGHGWTNTKKKSSNRFLGRTTGPATKHSHTDMPLTEADIQKVRDWSGSTKPGFIYMVKAVKERQGDASRSERSEWVYKGKFYNMRGDETLAVDWLTENHMIPAWRQKTILAYPNRWFRVPILASAKQSTGIQSSRPPSAKQSAGIQSSRSPSCIANCLIKFFDHVGLTRFREAFKEVRGSVLPWHTYTNIMRRFKAFGHRNFNSSICPLRSSLDSHVLYLFQIRSVNEDTKEVDNSHAICVFNRLIYDANLKKPLPVNKVNLDKCCVGGKSWVYQCAVRCSRFQPSKKLKKFIQRHSEANKIKFSS